MGSNRDFENILDNCLQSLLLEGGTVEQCLDRYPQHADELRPLLDTFLDARGAASISPSAAFRERARNELRTELREMEHRQNRSFFSFGWLRQPQWASAAIAVVILLAVGSTAAAASGSMPGQFLYPVKRATEQVQLTFTFSSLGKAEANARLADKRVKEIVYLASNGDYAEIATTTAALDSNLQQIARVSSSGALTTPAAMTPAIQSAATLAHPASPSIQSEDTTEAPTATETSPPEAGLAPKRSLATEAAPSASVAAAAAGNSDPWYQLQAKVAAEAGINIDQLQALLAKVPESARPALLKAISVSQDGYRQALESLNQHR